MKTNYILGVFTLATIISCTQKSNTSADAGSEPVESTDTVVAQTTTDTVAKSAPISEKQLINPGTGIGQLRIDATTTEVYKILGKPDSGDNAMGSSLAVWYADHKPSGYSTSVFASHKYGSKDEQASYVKKIMVNSPWFKTKEGVGTGSTLAEIKTHFNLKQESSIKLKGQNIDVYTDLPKGITFEVDPQTSKCSSIIVGRPNEANGTYLNMH